MKYIILIVFFITVSACSSFTSPARKHELDSSKSYWMDYDVTRRGTIVAGSASSWKACAEPAPDAAIGVVAKLEGSVKVADQGEASGKGELAQSIVNLAEKTQMVLFLRESLFRLCELSINTDIDADKTKELYETVINAALALVEKETAEINLEQQRLAAANQAQFIYQYLLEKGVEPDIAQELLKDMQ
jgi:type III secretion system FlhB-like substrate exporter